MRKIDAFPHIWPAAFYAKLQEKFPQFVGRSNFRERATLFDLDARFRVMDTFEDYVQVLTLGAPAIEEWAKGPDGLDVARIANEGMAELVQKYPDRFVGFVAALNLEDIDGSLQEADRAIHQQGALGVQIYTNVNGHPLDEARFEPLYASMERWGKPIWGHPTRSPGMPDYPSETVSKYGLHMKFGWPYETAIFMSRLIYSGIMDRYPALTVLTHHAGGIVPHVAGRITLQQETPEARRELGIDERFDAATVEASYRRFYGDTVFSGAHAPLDCALDFFGDDHILFGTDFPFGVENGEMFIRETIAAVEEASPERERLTKLFETNAQRVLGVK